MLTRSVDTPNSFSDVSDERHVFSPVASPSDSSDSLHSLALLLSLPCASRAAQVTRITRYVLRRIDSSWGMCSNRKGSFIFVPPFCPDTR